MEQVKNKWGDPVWLYRDFIIHREPYIGFQYQHKEYDVDHTGYGNEKTLEAVKEAIDEWYLDQD
jgi:hypothetical protein